MAADKVIKWTERLTNHTIEEQNSDVLDRKLLICFTKITKFRCYVPFCSKVLKTDVEAGKALSLLSLRFSANVG
jgi:hypothetical protein